MSVTTAARNFSDLVNRVAYRNEEFLLQRGGEPVCRVAPVRYVYCSVAALEHFLRYIPSPDVAYWHDVEAAANQ